MVDVDWGKRLVKDAVVLMEKDLAHEDCLGDMTLEELDGLSITQIREVGFAGPSAARIIKAIAIAKGTSLTDTADAALSSMHDKHAPSLLAPNLAQTSTSSSTLVAQNLPQSSTTKKAVKPPHKTDQSGLLSTNLTQGSGSHLLSTTSPQQRHTLSSPAVRGKDKRSPRARSSPRLHLDEIVAKGADGKINKEVLDDVWKSFDFNGNGMLSLAEIDKAAKQMYPHWHLDTRATIRAMKAVDQKGEGYVNRKQFGDFMLQLERMQHYSQIFSKLDVNGDGRISFEEFQTGHELAGVPMADDIKKEFMKLDVDRGGFILFAELVDYMIHKKYQTPYTPPVIQMNTIASKLLAKSPGGYTKDNLDYLFKEADKDGDGYLDKTEVVALVKRVMSHADPKVPGRALQQADDNGDGRISRKEFLGLVKAIDEMIDVTETFKALDADRNKIIDFADRNKIIDFAEFSRGFDLLRLPVAATPARIKAEFKKLDPRGAGKVSFPDFLHYMRQARQEAQQREKKRSDSRHEDKDQESSRATVVPVPKHHRQKSAGASLTPIILRPKASLSPDNIDALS
eukprot:g24230.t1